MSDETKEPEKETKSEDKGPDLVKAIEGLLARHGGSDGALRVLLSENHDHRETIRKLKESQPPAGSVVLKGDDVKAWESYVLLGKPSDLRKTLEEGTQAKTEAASLRKSEIVREAADLHGLKPGVLKRLADGLDIVFVDSKGKDGKPVREAHIKGEGDATTPLVQYAEKEWVEFLPSLKVADPKGITPGTPPRRNGAPTPTPVVTQGEARVVRPMF